MSVQNEAVHSITALNSWFICNKLKFVKNMLHDFFLLILLLFVIL